MDSWWILSDPIDDSDRDSDYSESGSEESEIETEEDSETDQNGKSALSDGLDIISLEDDKSLTTFFVVEASQTKLKKAQRSTQKGGSELYVGYQKLMKSGILQVFVLSLNWAS